MRSRTRSTTPGRRSSTAACRSPRSTTGSSSSAPASRWRRSSRAKRSGGLALDHARAVAAAPVAGARCAEDGAPSGEVPPAIDDGNLIPAGVAHAEIDHLAPEPVALPVEVVLEARELLEAVAIIARVVHRVRARAVAHRDGRDLVERLLERVAAKARRVPRDDDRARHQAPTSA